MQEVSRGTLYSEDTPTLRRSVLVTFAQEAPTAWEAQSLHACAHMSLFYHEGIYNTHCILQGIHSFAQIVKTPSATVIGKDDWQGS